MIWLITILLGWLGVHDFVLGRKKQGWIHIASTYLAYVVFAIPKIYNIKNDEIHLMFAAAAIVMLIINELCAINETATALQPNHKTQTVRAQKQFKETITKPNLLRFSKISWFLFVISCIICIDLIAAIFTELSWLSSNPTSYVGIGLVLGTVMVPTLFLGPLWIILVVWMFCERRKFKDVSKIDPSVFSLYRSTLYSIGAVIIALIILAVIVFGFRPQI